MADSNYSNLRKLIKLDACFRNPNPDKCTLECITDSLANDPDFGKKMSRASFYDHVNNFRTMGAVFKGHESPTTGKFIAAKASNGKTAIFQYADPNQTIPALRDAMGQARKDSGIELLAALEHDKDANESVLVWLRLFLNKMLKGDGDTSLDVVSFYDNIDLMAENKAKFEKLLEAILNKQPLEITYAYGKRPMVKIQPYLLKNYNQRWYLIGKRWNDEHRPEYLEDYYEGYANLALNGILDIKPWNEEEWIDPDWDEIKEYYDEIVGVTSDTKNGPQHVYLRFDKKRYEQFVATKPIVRTQKLVKEGDEHFDSEKPTVHLFVNITKELTQQILSFGPDCTVIAPESLRQEIKEKIAAMAANY